MAIGFYHNSTICTECKACQIACKDIHNLDAGCNLRTVSSYEGGTFPNPWVYFLSIACNHCESPACFAACSTGAISKLDDGTVVIDAEKCDACQACVDACPYGAPAYVEKFDTVMKCDGCKELRDQGLNPACVDACLMRALEFGDIDELRSKHSGENLVSELPPLPDETETSPNLIINAKEVAIDGEYRTFDVE